MVNVRVFPERTLQFLAVALGFIFFVSSPLTGWSIFIYLFTTRFWWFALFYSLWLYYDRNTPEFGGRIISCFYHSNYFKYVVEYFPAKLVLPSDFTLDPERNYLVCDFPHGVLGLGHYANLTCSKGNFVKLYPKFKVRCAVLRMILLIPFIREIFLGIGGISCSTDSLNYVLSQPEGGNVVVLTPGGAAEAYYSKPGKYVFFLKNRKGFVKIALKNGTPLIPAITFGEVDTFSQVESKMLRPIQDFVKRLIGLAPILFYGRGLTEGSIGLTPRRTPLTTVLGAPIEVARIENPTNQQVDELHEIFIKEIVDLFNTYKYKFLENPDEQSLTII